MDVLWNRTGQTRWDALTPDVPMQQAWAYGAACASLGSEVLRAEVRVAGQSIALAQFVRRTFFGFINIAVCTRGPVWLAPLPDEAKSAAMSTLREALPLSGLRAAFFTPDEPEGSVWLRAANLKRVMTPYTTAELALSQSRERLLRSMHGKWRNRLKAAQSAGLTIGRTDKGPERYQWLLDHEVAQQGDRKYAALPPALVPAWQNAGGRNALRILTADHNGERAASMAFLINGARATYHIGWSSDVGKRVSAHNLILWSAIETLHRLGVRTLDLGGLNTQDVPGIARFKLGTGARPKTLCGTWLAR